MKLWLIERTDEVGYDEFDSIVVAANTQDAALIITPKGGWGDFEFLEISLLGTAKAGTQEGIIHTSFNAG